jgi:hypothetical protein
MVKTAKSKAAATKAAADKSATSKAATTKSAEPTAAKAKTVVLFCRDTPGLTLGPNNEIQFRGGFAEVDESVTPGWKAWIEHAGTPFIREVKGGMPTDNEKRCPICGDAQTDAATLTAHYGAEHPPKPVPVQPPDQKPIFVHEVGGTPVLVQPPAEPIPQVAEPQLIFPKGGKQLVATSGEISAPAGGPASPGTSSAAVEAPKREAAATGGGTAMSGSKAPATGPGAPSHAGSTPAHPASPSTASTPSTTSPTKPADR